MNEEIVSDIEATHSLLNYLYAAFCGKYSWCQVLSKLQSSYFSSGDLVLTKEHLRTIEQWIKDLYDDKPLIQTDWSSPETSQARAAFSLLDKLKFELIDLAEKLDVVISAGDYSSNRDRVSLLTASFVRFAYSRNTYCQGFLKFANHLNKTTLEEQYTALLPQAEYDVRLADLFVGVVSESAKAPMQFFKDMRDESILLPGIFKSNVHDINQLQSIFDKPFTFAQAEISEYEAKNWQALEISPATAGYWKAYGFLPKAAEEWRQAGLQDPSLAAAFHGFEFIPQEAISWLQAGIPPCTAKRWRAAGYNLQAALESINQGVIEPPPPNQDEEAPPL